MADVFFGAETGNGRVLIVDDEADLLRVNCVALQALGYQVTVFDGEPKAGGFMRTQVPRFRLPGGVLGTRRHPDVGLVEFIASDARNLILIATSKRVFAISPKDAASLVRTFARATELGSLSPAEPVSVYPSFIVAQAWQTPVARFLWVSGLFLNIGLIVWVGILIPSLSQFPFGFDAFGAPNEPTAS